MELNCLAVQRAIQRPTPLPADEGEEQGTKGVVDYPEGMINFVTSGSYQLNNGRNILVSYDVTRDLRSCHPHAKKWLQQRL